MVPPAGVWSVSTIVKLTDQRFPRVAQVQAILSIERMA
jgi:hypothetical protein